MRPSILLAALAALFPSAAAAHVLPPTPSPPLPCAGGCEIVICSVSGCTAWMCDGSGCRVLGNWMDDTQAPLWLDPRGNAPRRRPPAIGPVARDLANAPRG